MHVPGGHFLDKGAQGLVNVLVVHQNGFDIRGKIVPDGAGDEVQVPVQQAGRGLGLSGLFDVLPELQQIVQVFGEFPGGRGLAGGADNEPHLRGQAQFLGQLLEALALFLLFDLPGDPQMGLLGQKHQPTAGKGYIGAEIGPLGGGLLLIDLDDEFLAFAQHPLNFGLGLALGLFLVPVGVHFRQGQEAVAFPAVINEGRLEAGLDIGHHPLVNIGFGGFPGGGFQGQFFHLPFFHDGHPEFLCIRGVDEHLPGRTHLPPSQVRCTNSRNPGWRSWAAMRLIVKGKAAGDFRLLMGSISWRRKKAVVTKKLMSPWIG